MCHVRVGQDVPDSLEASLAQIIANDRNDLESRSKLRLLRICKVLCADDIQEQLAIAVLGGADVDVLMYTLLGSKNDKP